MPHRYAMFFKSCLKCVFHNQHPHLVEACGIKAYQVNLTASALSGPSFAEAGYHDVDESLKEQRGKRCNGSYTPGQSVVGDRDLVEIQYLSDVMPSGLWITLYLRLPRLSR